MTKLKKLFPLSFRFTKSPVKLFLGILLYLVINAIAATIIDTVITVFMAPLLIFVIPYVGWVLALICFPIIILYVIVLSYVNTFALALLNIYTYAGIAVSFVAYAKSEDEQVEAESEKVSEIEEETEPDAKAETDEAPKSEE